MQIHSINSYNLTTKDRSYNNLSFEGFGSIKALMPKTKVNLRKQEYLRDECSRFGDIIGVKASDLMELTKDVSDTRFNFLKTLVNKYNARNFERGNNLKEAPEALVESFKTVTDPHLAHFNIINRSDAPFSYIVKLLKAAGNDKKNLEFVQKVQHEILGGSKNSIKMMTDMLTSPNKSEYMKNPESYSSYLKININNENAIKELDNIVKTGTYNKYTYDAKIAVADLMKSEKIRSTIGTEEKFLEQNYTEEGVKFLKSIFFDFMVYKNNMTKEDFSEILKIYKSCSKRNIDTRLDIIKRFKYTIPHKKDKNITQDEVMAMKKLFERIDTDKSSANFIYKILGDDIKVDSIGELNRILDIVPAKKAEIFHKNIARICRYTDEEERITALKNEIENPFFISEKYKNIMEDSIKAGFSDKESRIMKIAKIFENKINKIRYNRIAESENVALTETTNYEKQLPPIIGTEIGIKTDSHTIELKRTFKEAREAKKLKLKNDINEIIKQKLGPKTYTMQQGDYFNGAKIMRLKLLPVIFDSIKETRKMQKLAGQKPSVQNRDAIDLYSRITGRNKKLVNYMLKQTDSSGKKIFDIKDIIKEIDSAEQRIINLKMAKKKEFKSADAKAIYQHEFEKLLTEHGKLKRKRKVA